MTLPTTVVLAGHPAQVAEQLRCDLMGVSILRTSDAESTTRTLSEQPVDLVIFAPGHEGVATRVRERRPELAIIALAPREDGRLDPRIVLAELRIATLERRCAGLERSSRSLEDLAVAGRLSAGVVHEVNNILDGARRFLRLATKEEIPAGERKELLDHGLRALDRMGETLRAMLDFSRSAVVTGPDRAVGDVVDEALRLTDDGRARTVVTTALDPAAGRIPGTFLQVLVNLLRNAYRACHPEGRVRITARREPRQLRLTVEDDGRGFEAQDAEKLFAPFHRGQESGPGTGLGLYLSRTLVQRAGGRIDAHSDGQGRGARFTIVLEDAPDPLMASERILIVDDDRDVRNSLDYLLRAEGLQPIATDTAEAALALVASGRTPDVVVADFHLPGADGLDLLSRLRERCPELPFILVTGDAQRPVADRALELGASDFLAKPLNDAELLFRLRRLLDAERLRRENRALREQLGDHEAFAGLIGRSHAMQRIFRTVRAVAETRATLLIHGESGTGKSMLARALHLLSDRKDGPFIELACGALPEELIESELFGHVRGAFTGAIADRRGKVEAANGGTLFLDEIAVASPALQIKLLRVLQERAFERVGSTETIRSDLRLVLATNRDLETMVAKGEFREDLFYRINVVTVDLPPLRERPADVPPLARHFLARFSAEHRRPERVFAEEVLPALGRYAWPGNVRQLENAIERAVVLCCGSKITLEDFPAAVRTSSGDPATPKTPALALKAAMDPHEKGHLRRVLSLTRGNRCQAADILGINRSTLFNKMRKHALLDEDFETSS